ncbi:MAG: heme-binding protein [Chlorobium sp.]|jgi:SOUL heme-binding protein|nr:MAG: heme-binding protein [Chlorobium sp.]
MAAWSMLLMTSLMLAGCSVLGKRTANEPHYKVCEEDGAYEIRQYGDMIIAETTVEGTYGQTSGPAFSRLAGYIFGKNLAKQKIAMTAPVLQEALHEKIAMTAPVLQEKRGRAWVMAFVMPEGYTLESAPIPLDPEVKLRQVRGKMVAVISYSGLHSENNLRKYAEKLTIWLEKKGYNVLSGSRAASYDPPWTIPFLRRNEVHIDIAT